MSKILSIVTILKSNKYKEVKIGEKIIGDKREKSIKENKNKQIEKKKSRISKLLKPKHNRA